MKKAMSAYAQINKLIPRLIGVTNHPNTAKNVANIFVIIADQSSDPDGLISQK